MSLLKLAHHSDTRQKLKVLLGAGIVFLMAQSGTGCSCRCWKGLASNFRGRPC